MFTTTYERRVDPKTMIYFNNNDVAVVVEISDIFNDSLQFLFDCQRFPLRSLKIRQILLQNSRKISFEICKDQHSGYIFFFSLSRRWIMIQSLKECFIETFRGSFSSWKIVRFLREVGDYFKLFSKIPGTFYQLVRLTIIHIIDSNEKWRESTG